MRRKSRTHFKMRSLHDVFPPNGIPAAVTMQGTSEDARLRSRKGPRGADYGRIRREAEERGVLPMGQISGAPAPVLQAMALRI